MMEENYIEEENITDEKRFKEVLENIPKIIEERVKHLNQYPGHKPYHPVILLIDLIPYCTDSASFQKRIQDVEEFLDDCNDPVSYDFVNAAMGPIEQEIAKFSTYEEKLLFASTAKRFWEKQVDQRDFSDEIVGVFTRNLDRLCKQLTDEQQTQNQLDQKKEMPKQAIESKPELVYPMENDPWENLTITII